MLQARFFSILSGLSLILLIAMIGNATAGEKVKLHGTIVTTQYNQLEVGDEDGHVIAVAESKQVHFDELTGEKFPQVSQVILDFNTKTGKGKLKSYAAMTAANGDIRFTEGEGSLIGKGHWKGTFVYTKGTGKYEGIKGGGTWETTFLAPQISYMESEGEMEFSDK